MSTGTDENLAKTIDAAFEQRDTIGPSTKGAVREAVEQALDLLDRGEARVAEKAADGSWHVNQWLKKAVLLSFRLNDMSEIPGGPGHAAWWDKVPSKFDNWHDKNFRAAGFRAVPGCVVRRSAYIAPGVVLMPSFVNLGAYVDSGTMIDTWSTVGSCAQIGKNCHISGGVGIGGVLEPLQAGPVIVEDNCFIGARSEVAEGVIVREGAVLSMGVFIGASTKIVDRDSGEVFQGEVPAYSVVVPGTHGGQAGQRRRSKSQSLLRRHRQARRRKDPRQDQHQRTAAGLNRRPEAPMEYRELNALQIVNTIARLEQRISDRFPDANLVKVCRDLLAVARDTQSKARRIARPNLGLRLLLVAAVLGGLAGIGYVVLVATRCDPSATGQRDVQHFRRRRCRHECRGAGRRGAALCGHAGRSSSSGAGRCASSMCFAPSPMSSTCTSSPRILEHCWVAAPPRRLRPSAR